MLTNISGLLGTGKTLLSVILAQEDKKKGTDIKSNFHIDFAEKLNPLSLINFELSNCSVVLDEAHTIFDSRTSSSPLNRLFGYFFLQSRKRKVTIYLTAQFNHSVEIRIRDICDYNILCCPRKNKKKDNFRYIVSSCGEIVNDVTLTYENAKPFFKLYNTEQVIIPLMIDKDSVNFDEILEDHKACKNKSSFSTLVKKTYPNLEIMSINACYDFIKLEDIKRAKRCLFGSLAK